MLRMQCGSRQQLPETVARRTIVCGLEVRYAPLIVVIAATMYAALTARLSPQCYGPWPGQRATVGVLIAPAMHMNDSMRIPSANELAVLVVDPNGYERLHTGAACVCMDGFCVLSRSGHPAIPCRHARL